MIIADRKPIERRWVLIPTVFVVALLAMVRVLFTLNETVEFSIAFLLLAIVLMILMVYSYYYASLMESE